MNNRSSQNKNTPKKAQLSLKQLQRLQTRLNPKSPSSTFSCEFPQIVPSMNKDLPFPLTDIQQAYWLGRQQTFVLGNIACHIYFEIVTNDLDLPRFTLALNKLIVRHDMLRAIVISEQQQCILPQVPCYEIPTVNLQNTKTLEPLYTIRKEMSHQLLTTETWPLFEIRATLLPQQRACLHFSFDILICDGRSFQIYFQESNRSKISYNIIYLQM